AGHAPLWLGTFGLLAAPSRGLLVYSPALLLMPLGLWAARRASGWRAALVVAWSAAAALTVVFYGRWHDWAGGWCYGARFLCEVLPVCCLLFAFAYGAGRPWLRAGAQGLVALSVAVHCAGILGNADAGEWFMRHERADGGRCLFELHDTQIESWA